MALQYFTVCIFDFIVFPGIREAVYASGGAFHEWRSLTLQGGGLYHAAMGAICGVYAWQKTKEYLATTGAGTSVTERTTERSVTSTVPASADDQNPTSPSGKSTRAD